MTGRHNRTALAQDVKHPVSTDFAMRSANSIMKIIHCHNKTYLKKKIKKNTFEYDSINTQTTKQPGHSLISLKPFLQYTYTISTWYIFVNNL